MAATVIDGRAVAAEVRAQVAEGVREFTAEAGRPPGLATVLVGADPASQLYVDNKHKASAEVGIRSIHRGPDAGIEPGELLELIESLNDDPEVDGILVQMPLPEGHDPMRVMAAISPWKDVDGLTPANAGLLAQGRVGGEGFGAPGLAPCTPSGVMELVRRAGTEPEGAEAVIVGRSMLVGRPLAALLVGASATVTVCHSRTRDLPSVCRRAEILVAATGVPAMVRGEWVRPGATVIDVGINRTDDGVVGDVEFEAAREVAAAITPVPGGVGPMTIAMLLDNTLRAARAREGQALGSPR